MAAKNRHRVTAVMIVAKVPGAQGGEAYFRRGRFLPDSVTNDEVKRLKGLGLIETVKVEDQPDQAAAAAAQAAAGTPAQQTPPAS
ncbi:hypothetical protein [Microbacterium dauci]|uniref:Mu-like prophage FluMu N-terminal domain-containing protein n=1 Tax=Microbacterium dauci TaxID=3048008 RepID=A0ABT6ZAP3_9MICO|nr:hypothetical protein [Microbacterium sp. LX3-4]MDJ1113232.1 hypothetical protein [Microbacterium sp. LX3-4]